MDILASLSLLAIAKLVRSKFQDSGLFSLAIVFSSIIFLQIISSVMGLLYFLNVGVFFLGLIYLLFLFKKSFKTGIGHEFEFSDYAFLGFISFFKLFTLNGEVHGGDPFFWASYTRYLVDFGHIWQPQDKLIASEFFPGIPHFQSFFFFPKKYNESTLFFANGVFIFGYLMPFFHKIRFLKANYLKLSSILFSFIAVNAMFGQGWISLLTDHLVGITWGSSIIYCLFAPVNLQSSIFAAILFPASLYVRESGLTLAITLGIAWCFRCILEKRKMTLSIAPLTSPWVMYLFWKKFLDYVKMTYTDEGIYLSKVAKDFLNASPSQESLLKFQALSNAFSDIRLNKLINENYINFPTQISKNLPFLGNFYFWLLIIIFSVGIFLFRHHKNKVLPWGILVASGAIGWTTCHLIMWLYVQPCNLEGQCVVLSYDRYIQSFFLGLSLTGAWCWSSSLTRISKANIFVSFLILMFFFIQIPPLGNTIRTPMALSIRTTAADRRIFEGTLDSVPLDKIGKGKVLLLYKNEAFPVDISFIRYLLYPISNVSYWELGDRNFINKFRISDYKFILVINEWNKFKERYSPLKTLDISSNGLYRINGSNLIKIEKMPTE